MAEVLVQPLQQDVDPGEVGGRGLLGAAADAEPKGGDSLSVWRLLHPLAAVAVSSSCQGQMKQKKKKKKKDFQGWAVDLHLHHQDPELLLSLPIFPQGCCCCCCCCYVRKQKEV